MNEPDFVQGTLDWCNEIRSQKGMEPLARLPKGRKHDAESCPCGAATGLAVGSVTYSGFEHEEKGVLPSLVQQFVFAFDNGDLPQYDEMVLDVREEQKKARQNV